MKVGDVVIIAIYIFIYKKTAVQKQSYSSISISFEAFTPRAFDMVNNAFTEGQYGRFGLSNWLMYEIAKSLVDSDELPEEVKAELQKIIEKVEGVPPDGDEVDNEIEIEGDDLFD